MVDARDVGAVAAEIAASPASHAGKTYWLTGPELISNYGVAAVLSEFPGRTITYTKLSFDENRDAMIRAGVPAPVAEMNAHAFSLTAGDAAEWVTVTGVGTSAGSASRCPSWTTACCATPTRPSPWARVTASACWPLPPRSRHLPPADSPAGGHCR